LLIVLIATRVLWRRWKYDLHKVPSPPGLPLLGHTLEFLYGQPSRQLSQWVGKQLKQLGNPDIMRACILGKEMLFIVNVQYIKDVMMARRTSFPKSMDTKEFTTPLFGNDPSITSMFMASQVSPYVKEIRKVYTTAFQSKNLKLAMPRLNNVVQDLIKIIESKREQGPIDVQSLFVKMSLDAIGVVAFETNLGGLDGSGNIHELVLKATYVSKELLFDIVKRICCKLFPNCKTARRHRAIVDALTAEWDKLTKETLRREDPSNDEQTIWHGMRNVTDPDTNERLSFSLLRAELATVILGGMDTTGHQLAWLFALLAANPHVVEKIVEELKEHGLFGPDAQDVTFDDLGELTYLTAVIKEGLRVGYVFINLTFRMVPEDMKILGYRIPKGTIVTCPGTRAMGSKEMWGDPHVFRPERWLTDEDMSDKYSLGFSIGPRDCVGQKLAMLEMRLAVIEVLTHYNIRLEGSLEKVLDSAKDSAVVEAEGGIWVHFEPRSSTL